jgi:DNA-binding CsgD family transcriptional regulator
MVNRDEQMRWLAAALRTSTRGGGTVVAVEGAAGTGKTRFVHEARGRARASGALVLTTRALDGEREPDGAAIRRLCAPVLWRAAAAPLEADAAACATSEAFVELVATLAAERPLLIALDDAESCDRESLRMLADLALQLDHVGAVTLLVARRQGALHPTDPARLEAIVSDPGVVRIRLHPLDRAGVAEMIEDALGRPAERDLASIVHHLTGGVPALVEQVIHAVDAGEPLDRIALPAVAHGVRERAAQLGAATDDLVTALAVLGDDATLSRAAMLADIDHAAAAELTQALLGADVLRSYDPPRFAQPLLQPSLHAALPARVRLRVHGEAARVLAAEGAAGDTVARHLLEAGPAGDAWVAARLRCGAATAAERGDWAGAAAYLRRALAERAGGSSAGLSRELGSIMAAAGDIEGAGHLRRAIELTGSPRERAETGLLLVRLLSAAGETAAAEREGRRALAELHASEDDSRLRLRLAAELPSSPAADLPEPRVGSGPAGQLVLARRADAAARGGAAPRHVAELARRALSGGTLFAEAGSLLPHRAVEALVAVDLLDEAAATWTAALVRAESARLPWAAAMLRSYRSRTRLVRGEVAAAVTDARAALELVAPGPSRARRHATAGLAEALVEAGEADAAAALLDDPRRDGAVQDPLVMLVLARAQLALGHPADALAELDLAAAALKDSGVTSPALAPWRTIAAECHIASGDRARARELAEEELALARATGVACAQARALRVLGRASDAAGALEPLREAVLLLEGSSARLEYVRALIDLGTALRTAGQSRAARKTLEGAAEAAHRCGAVALASRARDELILAGARPRRPVHHGPDGLTRSERRVAELAAKGRTNREIGEGLFVTINTVAAHLASAYRKLGINSRAQLPAALAI